uniref:Uncharacterized protein n=1 Tax=Anguilla anguilla TaxID=7936 RepID=A0A0E9X3F3_ANGAN
MCLIHKCYIQNIFRQNLQLFILILESEFLEVPSSTYLSYLISGSEVYTWVLFEQSCSDERMFVCEAANYPANSEFSANI